MNSKTQNFLFQLAVILFVAGTIYGFTLPTVADARQGCCSHHDGVCGCECCDGTSLSSICAPYYPCPPIMHQPETEASPIETPKTKSADGVFTPTKKSDLFDSLADYWWAVGLGGLVLGAWIKDKFDKR